ncbi:glutamine synthetase-like protein [Kribbella sp. VKM Ac-2568]|nr:glutamine synthetase-like protein [Kribbella sp. VKM Ac-2568]
MENRLPGGDVNPYLAVAALIATTLREASALFGGSNIAREAFGDELVDHYANAARVELDAYDAAVTDWERIRGFERL